MGIFSFFQRERIIHRRPTLATADIGIGMGATGSDAAVESADVVFLGEDLR